MPIRLTLSPRNLEKNGVEVKWRHEKKAQILPVEGLAQAIKGLLATGS